MMRGSDHVATATQIQMIQALGGTVPTFAHPPRRGRRGEALSKRLSTLALRDLKTALRRWRSLSLMARLGSI
jgi:glutamyl-tRNA synthetase